MPSAGLALIDTDVIIRLISGDDLQKQARARVLFKRIETGELTVVAPVTVIADCLYVLTSRNLDYRLSKAEAVALLLPLLRLPHFRVADRKTVLRAMDLYAGVNLDWGDAYIAATMEKIGSHTLYSYDQGFDRLRWVNRKEPFGFCDALEG